jgi:DNA-binding TFAR19-related protein (PDSD5 family)
MNPTPMTIPGKEKDPYYIVSQILVEKGKEVLEAAMLQHPEASAKIVGRLAELVEKGLMREPLTGDMLLRFSALWVFL